MENYMKNPLEVNIVITYIKYNIKVVLTNGCNPDFAVVGNYEYSLLNELLENDPITIKNVVVKLKNEWPAGFVVLDSTKFPVENVPNIVENPLTEGWAKIQSKNLLNAAILSEINMKDCYIN